jgi:hypothetical protein
MHGSGMWRQPGVQKRIKDEPIAVSVIRQSFVEYEMDIVAAEKPDAFGHLLPELAFCQRIGFWVGWREPYFVADPGHRFHEWLFS